ncbi:unnamed protein product [Symbiodinium natans]|uniref:Uncharacterized protein n=1 Tax=Symbiodinium natans TaxID=878477 RepID=A0A812U376_9DINO|nr:unnamed protein product [Symbiodinium natans]
MKATWAQKKGLQVPESFKAPAQQSAEESPLRDEDYKARRAGDPASPHRHEKARSAILSAIEMLSGEDARKAPGSDSAKEAVLVQDTVEPVRVRAVRPGPSADPREQAPPAACHTPMQPPPAAAAVLQAASPPPNQSACRRFVVAPPMLPTASLQASTPILATRVLSPVHGVCPTAQVPVPTGTVSPCRPVVFRDMRHVQATSPPRSVSPCRPVAATPPVMRPSALAVQHQQHEMQQLQSNLRRMNFERLPAHLGPRSAISRSQSPQQGAPPEVRTASPLAMRAPGAAWPTVPVPGSPPVPGTPVAYVPRSMSPTPSQACGQPRTESPLQPRAVYPVVAVAPTVPQPVLYSAPVVQMRPAVCAGGPGTPTLLTRVLTPRQHEPRREVPAALRIAAPIFGAKEAAPAPIKATTPRKPAAANSAEPPPPRQFTPAPAGTMERVIVRSGTRS